MANEENDAWDSWCGSLMPYLRNNLGHIKQWIKEETVKESGECKLIPVSVIYTSAFLYWLTLCTITWSSCDYKDLKFGIMLCPCFTY